MPPASGNLLPERHAVELVQPRLIEEFKDPVGLGMPRVRGRIMMNS